MKGLLDTRESVLKLWTAATYYFFIESGRGNTPTWRLRKEKPV